MKKHISTLIATLGFVVLSQAQTLDDYLSIAAENNPGLQANYKTFEASLQSVAQAGSLPDPTLSFGYFISPVETRVGPQRARFSLAQRFPWFGTLKAQKGVVTLLAEAKYQEFLDARNRLFYEVSAAYYPLYELQRLIALEEENVRILSSYKDIATVQFKNGKGAMVDVLRADMRLNDAKTNVSILHQKKKPLTTRFNRLLNQPDSVAVRIQDTLVVNTLADAYRRDTLLSSNPLLEVLDLQQKASEAQERVAVKQGWPTMGVGLDYVMVGEDPTIATSDNGKDVFMPMISMSLPIFRGKYKAAQKEAQLMQASYALQKEEIFNKLVTSYEGVWFELQKQRELVQLYEDQIQTSEQSLKLLFSAYSNSGKDFEEVLRMQQQLLKYQQLKATTLSAYYIALSELDYITTKTK